MVCIVTADIAEAGERGEEPEKGGLRQIGFLRKVLKVYAAFLGNHLKYVDCADDSAHPVLFFTALFHFSISPRNSF